ncbi:MAG: SGNH/GDSL hydrolase family protein [Acidimicrobiales bacterium]|nr:SGNH/GDSL hydrolase family protein [Acidimicrobiales bacterium]
MRRSPAIVARLALTGTVTLTLGIAMLVAVLIEGSITPAFADTSPYELYCPGTPVGNVVINDVTTIGTLSPPSPSAEPFSLSGFQTQLTMPASVVSAFRALGDTSIAGSLTEVVNPTGNVEPLSVTVGPMAFDLPIPGSVPSSGLGLDIPPSPMNVNGFFSTPETIPPGQVPPPSNVDLNVESTTLTLQNSGTPVTVTCTAYANDTLPTSGISSSPPGGSPIAPEIAGSNGGGTTTTTGSATSTTSGSGPYYLALGDSVPVWNGSSSYPYQIASYYTGQLPGLQVVDMACSGETTNSMLANSLCAPAPARSQMQEATAFLQAHQGSVAFITLDIGGNDVVNCVSGGTIDVSCVLQGLTTMQTNLHTILTGLMQAAGPTVPIFGMNYFNPFLGDWLAGGSEQSFAVGSVAELTLFNQVLDQAFADEDVPVADVATAFQITDLTDMVSSPWGTVPVAVDKACTLLDITCTVGQPEGFGDDPVPAGATVIAHAFEQTIGTTISPTTTTTTVSPTTTTTVGSTTTTTVSPTTTVGSTTTTTVVPTTTSTTGSTTTTTSMPPATTSSTSGPTTTSRPPASTANAGSSSSSTTEHVVTASSGSLAFTGSGPGLNTMTLVGSALTVIGLALLVLVDVPHRALRRLPLVLPRRRR